MTEENKVERGKFRILDYGGTILSIYRKCSCGGLLKIYKDETGLNIARCNTCDAFIEWHDGDKIEDAKKNFDL